MLKKLRGLAGALAAVYSFTVSSSSALDDAVVIEFENKSVMSDNVENLRSGLPDMLKNKLEGFFEFIEIRNLEDYNSDSLGEKFPGLDFLINGSYSIINSKNISINSKIINLKTGKTDTQLAEGSVDDLFMLVDKIVNEMKTDLGYENKTGNESSDMDDSSTRYTDTGNKMPPTEPDAENYRSGFSARRDSWSFGPIFELSIPAGNERFKNYYNNSFSYGFTWKKSPLVNLGIAGPIIQYRSFPLDLNKVAGEMDDDFDVLEGGNLSFFNIRAGLNYYGNLDKNVVPVLTANAGYYWAKSDELSITINGGKIALANADTDKNFGILIGAGLEFLTSKNFSLELIGSYEHVFIGDGFDFVSVGVGTNYWGGR